MKDNKAHIGIFGRRNVGKSALINALTGQEIAIVSDVAGTTTDPVKKSMEISGLGPVVLIDTAGFDDVEDALGKQRVDKTLAVLRQIDLALLLFAHNRWGWEEEELISSLSDLKIPFLIIHGKTDEEDIKIDVKESLQEKYRQKVLNFSIKNSEMLNALIAEMRAKMPETAYKSDALLAGLVNAGDMVMLVTPIDQGAPEGRMILPQVQTWRAVMDSCAMMIACQPNEVEKTLQSLKEPPALVITDSQVFKEVDAVLPKEIPLTSFSILLMKQKGEFAAAIKGTPQLSKLKDGSKVLILEACTHQTSCDDIGRVKIPAMLTRFSGKKLSFKVVAGNRLSTVNPRDYAIVIQCGNCVSTGKQTKSIVQPFLDANIPVSNYGMTIAYTLGIFDRAVAIFTKK